MKVTCKITGTVYSVGSLPIDVMGEHPVFSLNSHQIKSLLAPKVFLALPLDDQNLVIVARLRQSPLIEVHHWMQLDEKTILSVFNGLHILAWGEMRPTKFPHFSITDNKASNLGEYLKLLDSHRESAIATKRLAEEHPVGGIDEVRQSDVRASRLLAAVGGDKEQLSTLDPRTATFTLKSIGVPAGSDLHSYYKSLLTKDFYDVQNLPFFKFLDLVDLESLVENWEDYSLLKPLVLKSLRNKMEQLTMVGYTDTRESVEDATFYVPKPVVVSLSSENLPTIPRSAVSPLPVKSSVKFNPSIAAMLLKRKGRTK